MLCSPLISDLGARCAEQCALDLPETEAPHLGVSSGGVDVDGGFAKVAGNSRLHSLLPAPTL